MKRFVLAPLMLLVVLGSTLPAEAATIPEVIYSDAFGGSGIHAVAPDGSDHYRVVEDEAWGPRWAPDGSGFAFMTTNDSGHLRRVKWVNADGSGQHTLISPSELPEGWMISSISWSPDGTQLLLSLWYDFHSRLYIYEKNGSSSELLARGLSGGDWSVTGWVVARGDVNLVVMRSNGANKHQLDGTPNSRTPRWSPDGSRIVYLCDFDVCVIDANGMSKMKLTQTDAIDWSPTWSPSGARIMWSRSKTWRAWGQLWVMQADGGKARRITSTPNIDEYEPDWR